MRGRGVKFGTTAVHHLCIIPSRFALWLHCRDFPWKSAGSPVWHNPLPKSGERRLLEV